MNEIFRNSVSAYEHAAATACQRPKSELACKQSLKQKYTWTGSQRQSTYVGLAEERGRTPMIVPRVAAPLEGRRVGIREPPATATRNKNQVKNSSALHMVNRVERSYAHKRICNSGTQQAEGRLSMQVQAVIALLFSPDVSYIICTWRAGWIRRIRWRSW